MRVPSILALLLIAAPAVACPGEGACSLGERAYHVRTSEGWYGVAPMPVQLHFHGWVARHLREALDG